MSSSNVPSGDSWRARFTSAFLWTSGFDLLLTVVQFFSMLILVRWLNPADYGIWAFATAVVGALAIFGARTFLENVLQHASDVSINYNAYLTAGLVIQTVLFVVAMLIAVLLTASPQWGVSAPLFALLSVGLLIDVPAQLEAVYLQRMYRFADLAVANAAGFLLGTTAALLLAWYEMGAIALAAQSLIQPVPLCIRLFRRGVRPRMKIEWMHLRSSIHFGTRRILSGVAIMGRTLSERSVISARFGFGGLGVFERAQALASLTVQKIGITISTAAYPALPQIDDRDRLRAVAHNLLLINAWIAAAGAAAMSTVGDDLVLWVYGAKWRDTVPLLTGAMLCGALYVIFHVHYRLLLSRSDATFCAVADATVAVLNLIVLLVVMPRDLRTYLFMLAGIYGIGISVLIRRLAAQELVEMRWYYEIAFVPVVAATVSFIAGALVERNLAAVAPFARVALVALSVGSVFLAVVGAVARRELRYVMSSIIAPLRDLRGR